MNLQTQIGRDLWLAIQSTYESENYSHAVLDAIHLLTQVLREKSGVDADGAALVGQALGGKPPRLRVNKLQTETEQNIQRGFEDMLRGIYRGIRNPRSHEQIEDRKDTADAIICFINYLLTILAESKPPFVLDEFLTRVFDPDFVASARYAELLAAEIPDGRLLDTMIVVYRRKHEGELSTVRLMGKAILERLNDNQTENFLTVVTDELLGTRDEKDIRVTLAILPPELWPKVGEVARLRIENKLVSSISEGELDFSTGRTIPGKGTLGIWARDFLKHFTGGVSAWKAIRGGMQGDSGSRAYIAKYFFEVLPDVCETTWQRNMCVAMMCKAAMDGEDQVRVALGDGYWEIPDDWRAAVDEYLKTDPELLKEIVESTLPF
jgi:uncharacterized protein (TIGR02391 family)